MENSLAAEIGAAELCAELDNSCKRLLSEKIILAWIMKSCLEEYKDVDVNEIAEKYIEGTPEIGSTGVDRDQTNRQINGLSNDDASVNENNIRYDIRFYALAPKDGGLIKLIINVEAQNSYHQTYPLITRSIYYMSRMISSQYGVEFDHAHYENIKKVYSIWVCMNPPKDRMNTITGYKIHEYPLIGEVKENPSHYDLMNAVMICLGDDPESQDNNILKLLEVLLSNDAKASEKKKILTEEFDISMSEKFEGEVAKMCNISEGVVEKTWRRGIEIGRNDGRREGIEIGEERNSIKLISNLMKNASLTFDQATAMLGIPDSDREEYRKLVGKQID